MMRINDIFTKDIHRPINGVVKAEQKNEAVVWQELDEYVVTREIQKHLHELIKAYLLTIDKPDNPAVTDNMGVWVSGFFGSGKSHFIKILSYLLGNIEAHNKTTGEIRNAVSFFEDKIKDPLFYADIKRAAGYDTDVILFNIDSKADPSDGKAAILSVFWRVFNEMQGFSKDSLELAEMERYLSRQGKYDQFCEFFKEILGSSWEKERDSYFLHQDEIVESLIKVLGKTREATEAWFENVINKTIISIEGFATQVKEYLDIKGDNKRIVFLVDEMGQFIGDDTSLMLNLQTITEDLGRLCGGRAWIIVTAQEAIDEILENLKGAKANDFSKIQGRFKTRISLSSSNTDEVIQARLLEKTPQAQLDLDEIFSLKGDIIRNQLSFTADCATLANYSDGESFVKNYPFTPYHFLILQKVFESIRKTGFAGRHLSQGERSMLDAFQHAAQGISSKDTGALAPMYAFYPCIESFLDTTVKRSIDQASEKAVLEPFDISLLQTLFLIRHVSLVKPNIENLVTLCIDEVDADRIALKKNILDSLVRLEHEYLISSSGDLYYFLTNEEREVSQEIKSIKISSGEETRLISEIIFDDILKEKIKHRYVPYKKDYPFNRICDDVPYKAKTDCDLCVEIITPMNDEYVKDKTRSIMYSTGRQSHVIIELADNADLSKEVINYKQTEKYIKDKHDTSLAPSMKEILSGLANENRQRKSRISQLLSDMILQAEYYAMGSSLEIKASTPQAAVDEGLNYLVQNIYNKFNYLKKLHDDPIAEIREILTADDITERQNVLFMEEHIVPQDLKEIMQYISMLHAKNRPIILSDIVRQFASIPYGWPEWEVVLLVAKLFMGSKIHMVFNSAKLKPDQAIDPLTKTSQWKNVRISERSYSKPAEIKKARDIGKEVFGIIGPESQEKLHLFIIEELNKWYKQLLKPQSLADTGGYPGKGEIDEILSLILRLTDIHDSYEFIRAFNDASEALLDAHEDLRDITDFYTHQLSTWESLRDAAAEFKPNRLILEQDDDTAKNLMRLDEILSAPRPYGMLSSSAVLISAIRERNDTLVEQAKGDSSSQIDKKISDVKSMLDEMNAEGDLRNKALYPLQSLKTKVDEEPSISNIQFLHDSAQDLYEKAIDLLETEKAGPEEEKPKMKPVKDIKASAFTSSKIYLETENDVEEFTQRLKAGLLEAIKGGSRVRIK